METRWVIIDGYSLMHRDPEFAERKGTLASVRQRLVRKVEEVAGSLADRITIVFDGTAKGAGEGYEAPAVEVVFSPGDKTADTVIERMVHGAAVPEEVLVVTSDLLERQTVAAARAQSMSCGDFLDLLGRHARQVKHRARPAQGKAPRATLGDFFPPEGTQRRTSNVERRTSK